jgi:hypothetical protein
MAEAARVGTRVAVAVCVADGLVGEGVAVTGEAVGAGDGSPLHPATARTSTKITQQNGFPDE